LDNNIKRLATDHKNARHLAEELATIGQLSINLEAVQTSMLHITPQVDDASALQAFLHERKILIGGPNPGARMVIHMDISADDIDVTIKAFKDFYKN